MKIWVDADACPNAIKEILYRAAKRVQIPLTLVSNQYLNPPASDVINAVQVPPGFDGADYHIVEHLQSGDLVITADIPLAAAVIDKLGHALNPRGELYTQNNMREQLAMRNFMQELREGGLVTGGPPPLNQRDLQKFANQLDRFLARHHSQ